MYVHSLLPSLDPRVGTTDKYCTQVSIKYHTIFLSDRSSLRLRSLLIQRHENQGREQVDQEEQYDDAKIITFLSSLWYGKKKGKRTLISRLLEFLSLRNAQTIQPTTAWTAISSPSASTRYSFLHLRP